MVNNPAIQIGENKVYSGHNLDVLKAFDDNSIDSIVTDPPYELGFMGKSWDNSGIAYNVELWQECLRVLKPGGHLLAFGGSRTWHRLAVAIEDAGFEMRDSIAWLYGSGFPKSHNISKAIDKLHGAEREVITDPKWIDKYPNGNGGNHNRGENGIYGEAKSILGETLKTSLPATDDAKQWDGWGTALKPAFEPIVVARKPLIGTVAENVLQFGTGGINIDASRIGTEVVTINTFDNGAKPFGDAVGEPFTSRKSVGRWPANVILDETTAQLLDKQSGISKSVGGNQNNRKTSDSFISGTKTTQSSVPNGFGDVGGASRFFYVAKASKRDRNEGLDELPTKSATELTGRKEGSKGLSGSIEHGNSTNPFANGGSVLPRQNFHPTVKPTQLMKYLVKLVTPPNGIVLDPFTGSGSTGKAAILEGYTFIGIELTADYLPIIAGRLEHAYNTHNNKGDDLFE